MARVRSRRSATTCASVPARGRRRRSCSAPRSMRCSAAARPPPWRPLPRAFLTRCEPLRLRARRRFLGRRKGSHLSPRRGTSLEFADYRSYSAGDDPRSVGWGLYARTDRLYVKVFQEEEDLFGYVFFDASASMAHPAEDRKFEAATALGLALCYVIL